MRNDVTSGRKKMGKGVNLRKIEHEDEILTMGARNYRTRRQEKQKQKNGNGNMGINVYIEQETMECGV